jgi:hypothetical protein
MRAIAGMARSYKGAAGYVAKSFETGVLKGRSLPPAAPWRLR